MNTFYCFISRVVAILSLFVCYDATLMAQTYNYENTALANFLRRQYETLPFEGIREIEDYNDKYLECVVTVSKNRKDDQQIERITFLKASRMVSEYQNGIRIRTDKPLRITSDSNENEISVFTTSGITGSLCLLNSFEYEDKVVFIYVKKIISVVH